MGPRKPWSARRRSGSRWVYGQPSGTAGALSLLLGNAGDLLAQVGPQDVVAFTGSSTTGEVIRAMPAVIRNSVRVNVEADSLNAAVLGPDGEPGSETCDYFLKDVLRDMTQKAGQKCTAIRRVLVLVPRVFADRVRDELVDRLGAVVVGNPASDGVRMGPVATAQQHKDVREGVDALARDGRLVFGNGALAPVGAPDGKGYYVSPVLLEVEPGAAAPAVHSREVFGPVATVIPYDGGADEAAAIVSRGQGGLVSSVYFGGPGLHQRRGAGARAVPRPRVPRQREDRRAVAGPRHGAAGPVHGGPGRAGGGEELGGLRGLDFYTQRVALEGSRPVIDRIIGTKG